MKKKQLLATASILVVIILVGVVCAMRFRGKELTTSEQPKNSNSSVISNSDSSSNEGENSNQDSNSSNNGEKPVSGEGEFSNSNSTSNINSTSNSNSNSSSNKSSNTNSNSNKKPLTIEQKVDNQIKQMTLEEKIGQMLIISVNGTAMTNNLKSQLTTYKPGGVILFANNLANYQTTIKFVQDIKNTSDIPLIISIDQEGGKVQRLKSITGKPATAIPTMLSVGKKNDSNLAYSIGKVIGEELRVFGINMDFAPVLDVLASEDSAYIGSRSFGTNADVVSNMGISLGKGLEDSGVIAVYKHFPGHGSTVADSHYDLPVITKTKAELNQVDLLPFKNAIKNNAKVIMIGHLAIPTITNDKTPASLSKVLITDILKGELGYRGLVITDALNMGAISKNYTEKQVYELAINAGVDILLMPKSADSAVKYIKQSIQEGKITEKQIDESVRKILLLKYKNMKTDKISTDYLGSSSHKQIVDKVNN